MPGLPRPSGRRPRAVAAVASLFALCGALLAGTPPGLAQETVEIQFLNVSDWHGQLEGVHVAGAGEVGGAATLSSYWQADRAASPHTLTLTAGDAFGASPPLSAFFEERPAVLALRTMGFDADTFGNHNFNRGIDHLQQMIDLASAPAGPGIPGEPFRYVSANLHDRDDNLSGVEDFALFDAGGVPVAVIGLTNPEAPELVSPGNLGTIEVTDPVPAANRARAAARRAGAQVVVALTHMGVRGFDPDTGEPFGELVDFAQAVGGFDVIFGDHTDVEFEGVIDGQLVLENRSLGRTYSRTRLTVDRRSGLVLDRSNAFVTPLAGAVTPDPGIEALLQPFRDDLAEVADEPIGVATGTFPRGDEAELRREVAIGNLVADALRERSGSDVALVPGRAIRSPLPSGYTPQDTTLRRPGDGFATGPPWDLVLGDAFTVLPYGWVATQTVPGAVLHDLLESSVAQRPGAHRRFLQVAGLAFVYDSRLPAGERVQSVTLDDGTPVPPDGTTYSVATLSFADTGEDVLAEALLAHVRDVGTVEPAVEGRITDRNPNG